MRKFLPSNCYFAEMLLHFLYFFDHHVSIFFQFKLIKIATISNVKLVFYFSTNSFKITLDNFVIAQLLRRVIANIPFLKPLNLTKMYRFLYQDWKALGDKCFF